jgi:hypothetical protein
MASPVGSWQEGHALMIWYVLLLLSSFSGWQNVNVVVLYSLRLFHSQCIHHHTGFYQHHGYVECGTHCPASFHWRDQTSDPRHWWIGT